MMPFFAFIGGHAGPQAFLSGASYSDTGLSPDPAEVRLTFNPDGTLIVEGLNDGQLSAYRWLVNGSANECTVSASVTSGSFTGGTSAEQTLDDYREFWVRRQTVGSKSCTATFTIKTAGEVLATASITLAAAVV